jgi:hypothetical protein
MKYILTIAIFIIAFTTNAQVTVEQRGSLTLREVGMDFIIGYETEYFKPAFNLGLNGKKGMLVQVFLDKTYYHTIFVEVGASQTGDVLKLELPRLGHTGYLSDAIRYSFIYGLDLKGVIYLGAGLNYYIKK